MSHPVILEKIKRIDNLPTLPGIALKILEAVRSEETSLDKIADILSKDPPLTAKILGLINSAFYGLPTKVTSISHAVKLLGINTVKKVALSFSLVRSFSKGNKGPFDYQAFWRNSLLSAVSCRLIAEKILPDLEEDAFTLGLYRISACLLSTRHCPNNTSWSSKNGRRRTATIIKPRNRS